MGQNTGTTNQLSDDVASAQADRLVPQKKTMGAVERDEVVRAAFREFMTNLKAEDIVVVDESGTHIGMTRLYARARRGQRAYAQTLRNHGKNVSLIASLNLTGIGATMTIEGAVDQLAFEAYVRECLAPSLRPGQIVLIDNLSIHKGARVRQLIETRGCFLLFLPAYSPDLSPIEKAFSKLKTFLRRVGALTMDTLQQAIADGLSRITPRDALGYFASCGFVLSNQSL